MYLLRSTLLLLSTLPVTFASPIDVTIQSREPKPMDASWPGSPKNRNVYGSSHTAEASFAAAGEAPKASIEFETGTAKPKLSPLGKVLVAGVVALDPFDYYVLVAKKGDMGPWQLPKRRWEEDERHIRDVAFREARASSGFQGTVGESPLATADIDDSTEIQYYEFFDTNRLDQEVVSSGWQGTWVSYEDARGYLDDKEWEIVGKSRIKRVG